MSNYKYKSGFFGGKFIPFHLGHALCISVALALCETVHVILFINGDDELAIQAADHTLPREYLTVDYRVKQLKELIKDNPRVKFHIIDTLKLKNPDGSEDWDAETPLVLEACGHFDAVFSSEPSYDDYFKRAYPWATHVIVDAKREKYPISATMIRDMTPEEADKWLIKPEEKPAAFFIIHTDYLPEGLTCEKLEEMAERKQAIPLTKENLAKIVNPEFLDMTEEELIKYIESQIKEKNNC